MSELIIAIHNAETGEVSRREMTADELAQLAVDKQNLEEIKAAKLQAEATKAALLEKLGITEEEAKLLLS